MTSFDVAVVGAGPAGSAAAWQLARDGARVAVFDPSHPREKPCGGGLTERAVRLVGEMLGPAELSGVSIEAMKIGTGRPDERRAATVALPGSPALVVVARRELDAALLRSAVDAGATLKPERVTDVRIDGKAAVVSTRRALYRATAVVGADGATSVVRRRFLAPFTRDQFSIATGFFVDGRSARDIVIQAYHNPPGYLWSFPRRDHLAVGICASADRVRTAAGLQPLVRDWLEREGLGDGNALRPYSWPIPSLGFGDFGRMDVAGPGWLLAGDAAGLVDPLTREGLYYALRSGLMAAAALREHEDPWNRYSELVHDELTPELSRAAALQSSFFSSGFTDLLVHALTRSEAVRGIMADLVAGRQEYRTLRRRLLGTFEMGLAVRLLQLQLRGMVGMG